MVRVVVGGSAIVVVEMMFTHGVRHWSMQHPNEVQETTSIVVHELWLLPRIPRWHRMSHRDLPATQEHA